MTPSQIQIGTVYQMNFGYYRKPLRFLNAHGVDEVEYLVCRQWPGRLDGLSRGPVDWFANNIVGVVTE